MRGEHGKAILNCFSKTEVNLSFWVGPIRIKLRFNLTKHFNIAFTFIRSRTAKRALRLAEIKMRKRNGWTTSSTVFIMSCTVSFSDQNNDFRAASKTFRHPLQRLAIRVALWQACMSFCFFFLSYLNLML